jgi:flagellar motor switch/type III secretory pathway protein FliN
VKHEPDGVTPIMLLGDTRKRVIGEYVRAGVERWRRAWAEDPKPRITVEVAGTESLVGRWSSQSCFQANSARGATLCMFVAPRCLPAIAGLRGWVPDAAHRQSDPDTLAARLEFEGLQRLARELLSGARTEMTTFERTPLPVPAAIRQFGAARCPVASITLGEAEATFSIVLSPVFVAALLPTRNDSQQDERVEPRKSAVAEQSVGVEAVLGHAEVSIRELAQLAVGDVIVMDEVLSDPGSLQVEGGGRVCRVALGRLDGRRAVQFRGKIQ